jgi:hypothetical protein
MVLRPDNARLLGLPITVVLHHIRRELPQILKYRAKRFVPQVLSKSDLGQMRAVFNLIFEHFYRKLVTKRRPVPVVVVWNLSAVTLARAQSNEG